MLGAVTESTGEIRMLGCGFLHISCFLFMAGCAKSPRCGHGWDYLQRMMGRMAAKAVAGNLTFNVWFVALGTIGDLAMDFVTEGTVLLGMGGLVVSKILTRTFMAGKAGILNVVSKMQGQRFMRVGVTGQAVFQFKMRPALMTL
jgi:hypothetical protein